MANEDRTFSIGTCDREFEKIQNALHGLSQNLDKCLMNPSATSKPDINCQGAKSESSKDLNLLVSCSNEEFDEKIKNMNNVDIDMAIFIFEEQIQIANEFDKHSHVGISNLSQLREKLTKCFMTKIELSKRQTKVCGIEQMKKDDACGTEEVAALEDLSSLSFAELQALLFYNGISYDESKGKDVLVSLVRSKLFSIDDEEVDDWVPPGDHEIQWKSPQTSKYETENLSSCDQIESSGGSEAKVDPRKEDGNQASITIEEVESRQGLVTERRSTEIAPGAGDLPSKTQQGEEKGLVDHQPTQEAMAYTSDIQSSSHPRNHDLPVKEQEEGSVVAWDPTPILKDLNSGIKRPEVINFGKPPETNEEKMTSKLEGYLEKLPVNQTKATLFKGWKKRYFRIMQGKIHYFEDHLAEKPLGSMLLTGCDLKAVGDKELQVAAQSGKKIITIRCSSSNETKDWYRMIKNESAISTPVTAPVKVPSQLEGPMRSDFIIIDLGANTIKAGFVGEEKPRVVFPAVFAVKQESNGGRKFTESGLPDPSMCTCGYDALKPEVRKSSKLIFPLRPTLKVDKFAIKTRYIPGFIDKVLRDLGVDPQNATVILICQRHFAEKDKEIIFDYLFGHLGVSAVFAEQQALLALYSYRDTTGIIVDIGDHIDVFPVIEDCIIENASSSLPQGGQLVTENLGRLLSEGGYRFFSEVESYVVRYLKEKAAFVSLDPEKEIEIKSSSEEVDVRKYNLPGKQRSISISSERFRCTEGLFDPNKWGKDYDGIHKLVEKAVRQSGIDHRKELCRKIFLSGGTTMIEGLQDRLQKELKILMPEIVNIVVHAADNRANAAFMGASVIAEQQTFGRHLVDKESWIDHGIDIFKRMTTN